MAKQKKIRTPPKDLSIREQLINHQKKKLLVDSDRMLFGFNDDSKGTNKNQFTLKLDQNGRQIGVVNIFHLDKKWGFMDGENGNVLLHLHQIADGTVPKKGDKYEYDLRTKPNNDKFAARARRVYCKRTNEWDLSANEAHNHNLKEWAYIPIYSKKRIDKALITLSELAIEQDWRYRNSYHDEIEPLGGLKNYIAHTFTRLSNEGKIVESDNVAAFNTGLTTNQHDDIFAIFEPNQRPEQKWKWKSFCTAGKGKDGKLLVKTFSKIPERAKYISCLEDVYFDPTIKFQFSKKHVVIDGIRKDRYPPSFLEENLPNFSVEKYKELVCFSDRKNYLDGFASTMEENSELYEALSNRVEESINHARFRVKQNYRDAVPSYYPRENSIGFLLPISLSNKGKVDAVLVVSRDDSENKVRHFGRTIFPLFFAYQSARLISPPYSNWLTVESYAGAGGLD